jgi:hypothetical protein
VNIYYKSRIIILDDISTSLIALLLYIGAPFIITHNKTFNDYNKKYAKYLYHLINFNILFNLSEKAPQVLNKNYSNIY